MEYFAVAAALIVVLFAAAAVRVAVAEIRSRVATISRVEAKLDLLLKHANIDFDPYPDVDRSIIEALGKGRKIEAIKLYRRAMPGVGLKEAKRVIEAVQRRAGV
jgi:ribosomal protein L7/L12